MFPLVPSEHEVGLESHVAALETILNERGIEWADVRPAQYRDLGVTLFAHLVGLPEGEARQALYDNDFDTVERWVCDALECSVLAR